MEGEMRLRILPIELLCEVLRYLELEEAVKIAHVSGDLMLMGKIRSIGGLKDVKMVEVKEPGDISRVVRFSGMTTLEVKLRPRSRVHSDIGWVTELPGTLKHIRFKFVESNFIWLRRLQPTEPYGPYPFLYEAHSHIPVSLRSQFPYLESFEMHGGPSNGLAISPHESSLRRPDGTASHSLNTYWSYIMVAYFFNHLPTGLETLRSSLLYLLDVPHITLPNSLTSIHLDGDTLAPAPVLASIGRNFGESLIQLTWSAPKDSILNFAHFAPHLRSLDLHCYEISSTVPLPPPAIHFDPYHRSLNLAAALPISFPSGLRVLRLSTSSSPWMNDNQARAYLEALPSTLHVLKLCCQEILILEPLLVAHLPPHLTELTLGDQISVLTLDGLPKSLTHLAIRVIGDKLDFASLPTNLTRLKCQTAQIWRVEYSESLPSGLLRVKLTFGGLQKHFPLEHLILGLPRSIIHLELSPLTEWSYAAVAALPRALEVLKLAPGTVLSEEVLVALPRSLLRFNEPTIVISASTLPLSTTHIDSEVILTHVHALMPRGIAKRHQLRWKSSMWGWTTPSTLQAVVVGVSGVNSVSSSLGASFSSVPTISLSFSMGISNSSTIEPHFDLPSTITSLDLSEIPLSVLQEQDLLAKLPLSVTKLVCSGMCSASILARLRHFALPHSDNLSAFYQTYATYPPIDPLIPNGTPGWRLTELRLPHAEWLSFLEPPIVLEVLEVKHIESHLLTPLKSLHTLIQGTAHHATTHMQDLPHSLTYLSISFPFFLMGNRGRPLTQSSGLGYSTGSHPNDTPPYPSTHTYTHSSAPSSPLSLRKEAKSPIGERLLPPKLKTMLAPKSTVSRALFEALPPSVTHVKVGHLYIHDVKEMLIHLGKVGIERLDFATLSGAPPATFMAPCTAKVECGSWKMNLTEEDLGNLPQGLRSLIAPNLFLLPHLLPMLPNSLTSLDLRKLKSPLDHDTPRHLPRTLEFLFIDASCWTSDSLLDLPHTLKHLHITAIKALRRQHAKKLPRSLKTLIVDCRRVFDSTLSYLPPTLLHLSLSEAYAITIHGISLLPRSLLSLALEHLPDAPWETILAALPSSLTQLHPLGNRLSATSEWQRPENLPMWLQVLRPTGTPPHSFK